MMLCFWIAFMLPVLWYPCSIRSHFFSSTYEEPSKQRRLSTHFCGTVQFLTQLQAQISSDFLNWTLFTIAFQIFESLSWDTSVKMWHECENVTFCINLPVVCRPVAISWGCWCRELRREGTINVFSKWTFLYVSRADASPLGNALLLCV